MEGEIKTADGGKDKAGSSFGQDLLLFRGPLRSGLFLKVDQLALGVPSHEVDAASDSGGDSKGTTVPTDEPLDRG